MEELLVTNRLKAFQFLQHKNLLLFFNGWGYEELTIDELKQIKYLLDSTISNYDSFYSYVSKENLKIKEEQFKGFNSLKTKEPNKTKKGIIYIMKCERTNLYKIGLTAKSIHTRFNSLKTANPSINLFKYYEEVIDLYEKERELHNLFSKKRIDGEWFELNESDLCEIDLFFNVIPF
jgi:hypothetical protein